MKKIKYYQGICYKIVTKEDIIFTQIKILFAFCIYACEWSFDKQTEFHRTGPSGTYGNLTLSWHLNFLPLKFLQNNYKQQIINRCVFDFVSKIFVLQDL